LSWNEPLSFSDDRRRRPVATSDGLYNGKPFVVPVSPGFFETLSVPIVAGRDFRWNDTGGQRGVVINRGHRIRVAVAGSNYPRLDVNPNTGWPAWPLGPMLVAHNNVLCDRTHASHILLPVVTHGAGEPRR
jgi:hypothetical protein